MKLDTHYMKKARIEMIPLIDVIFLLLVTFILFTMSMTVHRGVPVALPTASTGTIEKKNVIDISVRQDGSLFIEGEKILLPRLAVRIAALHRNAPEKIVLISGDRKTSYEVMVAVMDAVRKAGIAEVSLETVWK